MRSLVIAILTIVLDAGPALHGQQEEVPDRALHRGLVMETGWTQSRGHGAGTAMLMLGTPVLDVGLTDRITVMAALPFVLLLPDVAPFAASVKLSVVNLPSLHGAVGAFATAGVSPFFAATVGTPRLSASYTLSPAVWTPREQSDATRKTFMQGLVAVQLGPRAKFLLEGIHSGEGNLVGAGLRLFRSGFLMELAGIYDPEKRQPYPWVTLAWTW